MAHLPTTPPRLHSPHSHPPSHLSGQVSVHPPNHPTYSYPPTHRPTPAASWYAHPAPYPQDGVSSTLSKNPAPPTAALLPPTQQRSHKLTLLLPRGRCDLHPLKVPSHRRSCPPPTHPTNKLTHTPILLPPTRRCELHPLTIPSLPTTPPSLPHPQDGVSSTLSKYPETLQLGLSVTAMGVESPEGIFIRTGEELKGPAAVAVVAGAPGGRSLAQMHTCAHTGEELKGPAAAAVGAGAPGARSAWLISLYLRLVGAVPGPPTRPPPAAAGIAQSVSPLPVALQWRRLHRRRGPPPTERCS